MPEPGAPPPLSDPSLSADAGALGTTRTPYRVAAVVVTYNRRELLEKCLSCLCAQRFDDARVRLDILVVDNASTDGTIEVVAPLTINERVRYFNTGANLGGAGGFAFGMEQAVLLGYDYVWVMDDDCLTEPGTLTALLDAADSLEGEWGFLSSVARWTDGRICLMNVQRHPLFDNITDFTAPLQPCTLASFVSLLVPAKRIEEVGLPFAEFFVWTDDWEFTRRLSRRWPCFVVGGSRVVHASATNGAGNIYTDTAERLDRYELIYRNDVVLYREEGLRGKLFLVGRALYHMARVVFSGVDQKARRLGIIARSNLAGAHFHPRIKYVTRADGEPNSRAL